MEFKKREGSMFKCIFIWCQQVLSPWTKHQFESINSWVSVFYFILMQCFTPNWSLFQLYGESINVSYIAYYCSWSFCVKIFLSHFCVMLVVQGLNLCRSFYNYLDLFCWPFPGINSLHHVFEGPCHEIMYQFQI